MQEQTSDQYDLIVVGGGITGLVSAYLAGKAGKKVAVVESSKTFGGLLNTFEIGGNRLEYFYHHFFTHDAELNWLIKELGLEDKLVFRKTSMGVFQNKKIYDFNGMMDLFKFKPISWMDKLKFGVSSLYLGKVAKWKDLEHVSAMEWLRKWAGKTTAASLWMPMLKIKFGPYAPQVPLAWMVGRLRQRMGSRKNGDERLGYLDGSLQVLLDALLVALRKQNTDLLSSTQLKAVEFQDKKIQRLVFEDGKTLSAGKYLFTLPSTYFARFIAQEMPEYAAKVDEIKYFGAVCVILQLKKRLSDVYWLNIAENGFPFGGVIEHTNLISEQEYGGSHIAYLSRYFAHEESIAGMDDEAIKAMMIGRLSDIYPHFDTADIIKSFVFRTQTAAPVCDFNFSQRVQPCQTPIANMYIANMSHVYPDERSVNNSVRIAAEACRVMDIDSSYVPHNKSMSGKIGF